MDHTASCNTGKPAHLSVKWHAILLTTLISLSMTACGDNVARTQVSQSYDLARSAAISAGQYFAKNGQLPTNLQRAGFKKTLPESVDSLNIDPADGTIIVRFKSKELHGKAMFLTPHIAGKSVTWSCSSDSLPEDAMPKDCTL